MLPKVYIDGRTDTTGLRIHEWMAKRKDVQMLQLSEDLRRNPEARLEQILESDVSVLCLPDDTAREVASWVETSNTRLIDASTAHRVADGWIYGLPELHMGQRELICEAKYVSNPGCYASAFVLLVRPLTDAGLIPQNSAISFHALSGYSGGGKSMISKWEDPQSGLQSLPYEAPYALFEPHKHIPEMIQNAGLRIEPQFLPAVGPFRCGMRAQVPIHASLLEKGTSGGEVWEVLHERYRDEAFVNVMPIMESDTLEEMSFDPQSCNYTNRIDLHIVSHSSGHILLIAILDNLGKGACGAAIQNLNLMLGFPEGTGLD